MLKQIIEFNKDVRSKDMPQIAAGDVVKVHMRIKEGSKERIQVFEGLIIAMKGGQSSSPTITVRKVSHGVGVEMIFPIYSPNIDKIDLVKRAKVRRAKLYYIRDLTAKQSRMKYKDIKDIIKAQAEPITEIVEEAVAAPVLEQVVSETPVAEAKEEKPVVEKKSKAKK